MPVAENYNTHDHLFFLCCVIINIIHGNTRQDLVCILFFNQRLARYFSGINSN